MKFEALLGLLLALLPTDESWEAIDLGYVKTQGRVVLVVLFKYLITKEYCSTKKKKMLKHRFNE